MSEASTAASPIVLDTTSTSPPPTAAAVVAASTTPTQNSSTATAPAEQAAKKALPNRTIRIHVDIKNKPRPVIVNYRQLYKRELKKLEDNPPVLPVVAQDKSADLFYEELLRKAESYAVDDDDVDDDGSDDENGATETRKQVGNDYDFEDPFIDDSEMLMDEPHEYSAPEFDGFFVYYGPLDGHEVAEKKSSTVSSSSAATKRKAPSKSKSNVPASSNNNSNNSSSSKKTSSSTTGSGTTAASSNNDKSRKKTTTAEETDEKKSGTSGSTAANKLKKTVSTPVSSTSSSATTTTTTTTTTAATTATPTATTAAKKVVSDNKPAKKKKKLDHTDKPASPATAASSSSSATTSIHAATNSKGGNQSPAISRAGSHDDRANSPDKSKKKTVIPPVLKPLDPEIEILMEKLRHDVKQEDFQNKAKFPPALKPTVLEAGLLTFRKHRFIDDNLVYHLMNILPYNKFTLKKFLTTKSGQMRVDELQQEIDELAISLKQTIDRMMPEQQRLYNEKLAQAQASGEPSNKNEDEKEEAMPLPKFKCNDEVRKILYNIIQTEEQSIHIANQVAIHKDNEKKSEGLASDGKARKLMYQRLLSCWPEGWMHTYEMSRQYSQYKAKVSVLSEKKNAGANSSVPTTPKANISTIESKKRKRTTPQSSPSEEGLRKTKTAESPNTASFQKQVITIDTDDDLEDDPTKQPSWRQSNSMKIEALISGPSDKKSKHD